MSKLKLNDALTILKYKKGAGIAKKSKLHLEIDYTFESGISRLQSDLKTIPEIINTILTRRSDLGGYDIKNMKIIDKSWIETDLINNPDKNY
jgi:hypothetical protein